MLGWIKSLFRRRRPSAWPRHLFVQINGVGLAYVAPVGCQDEATDLAMDVVGRHAMKTGEISIAHHWTTERPEDFTRWERKAFEAAGSAVEPMSANESRFS